MALRVDSAFLDDITNVARIVLVTGIGFVNEQGVSKFYRRELRPSRQGRGKPHRRELRLPHQGRGKPCPYILAPLGHKIETVGLACPWQKA